MLKQSAETNVVIPHISENFIPLSFIVNRVVESIYAELVVLLDTISSASDGTKKRKFLGFAVHARQQFIKLLVLTQWSANAAQVSKVIDVVAWLTGQKNCFTNVVWALQAVKRDLGAARLRNPDIATALEVFVLHEPRLSFFNYIKPDPLSPQHILSTLHDLNVLLSIRLSLTKIPDQFQKYSIADGRATFKVAPDYEVDLGIADSLPDSRFFLIDFRFLFKSNVTPAIRAAIEKIGNQVLIARGLEGLYDYLRKYGWPSWVLILDNFTLSYKLLQLQQQLIALSNGIWTATLAVAYLPDRQTIALHYWNRRSLVEIGILSSKQLGIKWVPKEFSSQTFAITQDEISAQTLLSQIITLHMQHLISSLHDIFTDLKILPGLLTLESDTSLAIKLTPTRTTTLTIQHLTGRLVLHTLDDFADLIASAEDSINTQTDLHLIVRQLVNLRHACVRHQIESVVADAGWQVVRINIRADDKYGPRVCQISTFRQRTWTQGWFVVLAISDTAGSLWFSELRQADGGWTVAYNEQIEPDALDLSAETLNTLAVVTSARITFHIIADGLRQRKIAYETKSPQTIEFSTHSKIWATPFTIQFDRDCVFLTGALRDVGLSVSETTPETVLAIENDRLNLRLHTQDILDTILDTVARVERAVTIISTIKSAGLSLVQPSLTLVVFEYSPSLRMAINISTMRLSLSKANPHCRIKPFLQDILRNQGLQPLLSLLMATLPILHLTFLERDNVYFLVRSIKHYRLVAYEKLTLDIMLRERRGELMAYVSEDQGKVDWNAYGNETGVVGMGVGVACEVAKVQDVVLRIVGEHVR